MISLLVAGAGFIYMLWNIVGPLAVWIRYQNDALKKEIVSVLLKGLVIEVLAIVLLYFNI